MSFLSKGYQDTRKIGTISKSGYLPPPENEDNTGDGVWKIVGVRGKKELAYGLWLCCAVLWCVFF